MQGTRSLSAKSAYLGVLPKEIGLLGDNLPEELTPGNMHWSRGTPTLMPSQIIKALEVASYRNLPAAEDLEFCLEIDPEETGLKQVEALAEAGMTRACIGIQGFDPEIQHSIGRSQGLEVTRGAA